MANLKQVFKEYNCNLNLKLLKETKSEVVQEDPVQVEKSVNQDLEWPEEFLPRSKYSLKKSNSCMEMIKKWNKLDLTKVKNKKLVKILAPPPQPVLQLFKRKKNQAKNQKLT